MSLARNLDRILRRHLRMHVAWMPIVTRFSLGEYGLRRGGVFEPIGHIREFGAEIDEVRGNPAKLDFTSEDATTVRTAAGVEVDVLPDSDVEAELRIKFAQARSMLLKSPVLTSTRIANLAAIGRVLARARRSDGLSWSPRYRVVSELFTGEDVTLLSTERADTTVVLAGKAKLLRHFEAAGGAVGISLVHDRNLGLDLVGKAGSVGIDLTRFSPAGRVRGRGKAEPEDGLEPEPAGWDEGDDEGDDL